MCENTVNNIHKSIFLLCCPISASHVQFLEDLFKYHRKLVSKTEFRNIFLVRKIRTSFSKNTIDQKWETHNHPEKKMYQLEILPRRLKLCVSPKSWIFRIYITSTYSLSKQTNTVAEGVGWRKDENVDMKFCGWLHEGFDHQLNSWINFVLKDQILTMKQCVNRPRKVNFD